MDNQTLINADNISLEIDQRQILNNISLQINAEQIVTLIGPNGAGKTSLVKIALGLIKPTTGSVETKKGLRIGYMPQRLHIDQSMPVSVERFLKLAVNANNSEINNALGEVGADSLHHSQLFSLSGGELQRVLLARALIQEPQLLVLDEPAQGVDVNGQAELYRLISDIRNRHQCGILLVSHDLHLVMSATDEVICLNQHVCCHGHPEQVSNDPAYLELFGKKDAETLAVYTHHHNHSHDLAGGIVDKEGKSRSDHDG
ncbi:MAG: zinc ABC transporter ATP-binding protein ZnuC [Gammaproteobacteria bacterium]|nr:zinc ABC transporter ATP-binding protein ZnuC [Gammaproteobacteria bacterium]